MHVELKTERLLLRPLDVSDLETVHAYASDRENTRYMLFLPNDTLEETRAFLCGVTAEWQKEKPLTYEFAVVLDGRQIGAVSVALEDSGTEGELGWILHRDFWHKGYAAEAALAVRNFAIQKLGVMRLVAHCDARNTASSRVMEKLSMRLEDADGWRTYPKTGETARELMYGINVSE